MLYFILGFLTGLFIINLLYIKACKKLVKELDDLKEENREFAMYKDWFIKNDKFDPDGIL